MSGILRKEGDRERQWVQKASSEPRLLCPDPVHHADGTVLEGAEVFFGHTLRGVQEQVEVQMTRALDLDFSAHSFWEKCGRGGFRFPPPSWSLAKAVRAPCLLSSKLSPAEPTRDQAPRKHAQHPAAPTSSTHPSSSGWGWWFQACGTKRHPGQGPRPRESHTSRVLREEPLGSARARGAKRVCPGVSGDSGWLLTAADGLCPTPDPIALALPHRRPRQHQI